MTGDPGRFTAEEILDAVAQAVIVTDLEGIVVFWNAAAERLYGWRADEALGRAITDVTVPQVSHDTAEEIMTALRAGTPWSGGFPVQRRDGEVFTALVTDAGIYRNGAPVGIVGVSANLGTAVRPLLERSRDAALVLTAEGAVSYASPAVTPLFGWDATDLIGKPLSALVHPADVEALHEFLHAAGRTAPGRVIEIRLDTADGWVPAEADLTDLLEDPVVRGVVCNLHHSERVARIRERDRISGALHADILQSLFGTVLDLERACARAEPAERPRLEAAAARITSAISTLRRLVHTQDEVAVSALPHDPMRARRAEITEGVLRERCLAVAGEVLDAVRRGEIDDPEQFEHVARLVERQHELLNAWLVAADGRW